MASKPSSVPELVKALELREMPEGYHKVSVMLTAKELDKLKHKAIFAGEGTYSAAIRKELGWPESPYGLRKRLLTMWKERGES